MRCRSLSVVVILATALLALPCMTAMGWWDTIVKKWQYPPLVRSWEAEGLPGVAPAQVVPDPLAGGGKAVSMAEGGAALAFSADLAPSTYVVYIVGRSPRKEDSGDPGGMKPFYFHVTVGQPAAVAGSVLRRRANPAERAQAVLPRLLAGDRRPAVRLPDLSLRAHHGDA